MIKVPLKNSVSPSSTNLTSTNLLGLAPEAISDTATGTINTWGSRCESSSTFLGYSTSVGSEVVYEAARADHGIPIFDSSNITKYTFAAKVAQ